MHGIELRDVALRDKPIEVLFLFVQPFPGNGVRHRDDAVVRRDLLVVEGGAFDLGIGLGDGGRGRGEGARDGGEHLRRVRVLGLGKKAAVRSRIARDLVLFVEGLADVQGVFGGVAKEAACLDLNVRKRIGLGLQGLLALRFRRRHGRGLLLRELFNEGFADREVNEKLSLFVHALLVFARLPLGGEVLFLRAQRGGDGEVGLRLEIAHRVVAAGDHGEGGSLHAPDGDEFAAAELRLIEERVGARKVHA